MDKNILTDAITNIDDDILEKALEERQQLLESVNDSRNNSKSTSIRAMIGAAACLLIIASAVLVYMLNANRNPLPNGTNQPGADITASPSNEPSFDYEDSKYSAEQIAELFGDTRGDGTKAYFKTYFPAEPDPVLLRIPDTDTIPIFAHDYSRFYKDFDIDELVAFSDGILPDLTNALGLSMPDEDTYKKEINDAEEKLNAIYSSSDRGHEYIILSPYDLNSRKQCAIITSQDGWSSSCHIFKYSDPPGIKLNGEYIRLPAGLSNDEIIASLENIKNELFDIFNVSFTDVKVIINHNHSGYRDIGIPDDITVYYYNASDHFMNNVYAPNHDHSDSLRIRFSTGHTSSGYDRIVQLGYYDRVYIEYTKFRVPPSEVYQPEDEVRILSIEEAETLLNMGYVFGGHSCPICMEKQQPIDFTNYDYVGFEYLPEAETTSETGKTQNAVWIPFYTFYKYLETAPNGSSIYAKTYVPAIEVSGLPEFFSNQMKYHSDPQS